MKKTDLIQKLKQLDGLTADERATLVDLVNTRKKYGLVWEDKPEDVEEQLRDNLPVFREVKDKAILNGEDNPNHILIEGDNLHALTALTFTHEGRIDVIYIDPPYNTGNKDFKYNDSFVDKEDSYRHSKWLSFMSKRLEIAKRLLSDKGVIFISIDDNEQAQLKLLCNEIFYENNFVAELIWKKKQGGGNDSTNFVVEHEYVICYSKNISFLELGLDSNHELDDALYPFRDENNIEYGLVTLDKSSIRFSESLVFEIKDTDGNIYLPRVVKGKQSCWRWSKKKVEEEFNSLVFKNGKVYTKYYRPTGIVPKSILYETRFGRTESGKDAIKELLGNAIFSYPKPVELVEHFIRLSLKKNKTILDFFAGSGTTLQATIRLNEEDGGGRQCILVTNNENNICEEVTYERNKRVIQGYTNPKGEQVEGLINNNLRYYKSEFVGRETSVRNKKEITRLATELLCIKENIYTEQKAIGEYQLNATYVRCFQHSDLYLLVIYDEEVIEQVVEVIQNVIEQGKDAKPKFKVYVFSNGQYPYTEEFEEVLEYVTLCALPDAIYKAYQNVLPKRQRKVVPELEEPTAEEVEESLTLDNERDLFS